MKYPRTQHSRNPNAPAGSQDEPEPGTCDWVLQWIQDCLKLAFWVCIVLLVINVARHIYVPWFELQWDAIVALFGGSLVR